MSILNNQQQKRAIEVLEEYLSAPAIYDNKTPIDSSVILDDNRKDIIERELQPLLTEYLNDKIDLSEFKSKNDGINKRNEYWGFKGIKGQMFFNMVVNVSDDIKECDQELKSALLLPSNEQIASSRIKTFQSYVNRLGEEWIAAGNTKHGRPKVGSINFFLSYFWQLQDQKNWPVYYTNSVNTMVDLNLWQPTENYAEDYLSFKHIHEELIELYSKHTNEEFDLYKVEHVFWYKGDNPYQSVRGEESKENETGVQQFLESDYKFLPESYVPPIVAVLPQMAKHDKALEETAKKSGITLDRAFEKYIDATFTILGYDTTLLGQGTGRNPDGLARSFDDNYAIIWDAKVRENKYSMGTEDRSIREYITTHSRELKKKRTLRNIYYFIISSKFADDFDESIRQIKMDTDVSEVCLVESEALVAMVDAKLRAPLQISLGVDGLQRLFSVSGIIDSNSVREQLS